MDEELKRLIESIEDETERDVAKLLTKMGLNLIAHNEKIMAVDGNEIGEIDQIYHETDPDILFIVDATSSTHTREKVNFLEKWSEVENLNRLREHFTSVPTITRVMRVVVFVNKDESEGTSQFTRLLENPDNIAVFKKQFELFKKLAEIARSASLNDFYEHCQINTVFDFTEIDGIVFYLGDVRAFSYVDRVDKILTYCYVLRRLDEEEGGYQRMLNESKIAKIHKALEAGEIVAFPNSIIINSKVNLSDGVYTKDECPKRVKFKVPRSINVCRVVDGQHRVLGLGRLNREKQKEYSLPIIAFEKMSQEKEIRMFVDINSKQKKIDSNLILLLKSGFTWELHKEEYFEAMVVNIAKRLNGEGALKNKIYMGTAGEERKKKIITLTSVVTAVLNNNLIGKTKHLFQNSPEDYETPYNKINQIFNYVNEYELTKKFIYSNRGLKVLFRYVQIIGRHQHKGRFKKDLKWAIYALSKVLTKGRIKKINEEYFGEGGVNRATAEIIKQMKKEWKAYEKVRPDLRGV